MKSENNKFENIVNNLDLNGDGSLRTVAGDDLWLSYGPQSLDELTNFIGKVIRVSNGNNPKGSVLKTLIEETGVVPGIFGGGGRS